MRYHRSGVLAAWWSLINETIYPRIGGIHAEEGSGAFRHALDVLRAVGEIGIVRCSLFDFSGK